MSDEKKKKDEPEEPEKPEEPVVEVELEDEPESCHCENCEQAKDDRVPTFISEPVGLEPFIEYRELGSILPLGVRHDQRVTPDILRARIDDIKKMIGYYIALNPTKPLEKCVAVMLYVHALRMPPALTATEVIEFMSEVLEAYRQLLGNGALHVEGKVMPGTRIH